MRRTNIDELPQFLYALWNDVCNRSTSAHAAAYRTVFRINQQYGTSLCQISGWAQVNGFRGETKELIEMKDRVDFDIWYIENWSTLLDIKIIYLSPSLTCLKERKRRDSEQ
jgi:undecaprenyl-phosphate galactose phosphotransferase/putative colanic acid biosynthesis UDP-glucose lipid carrier transferase